MKLRSVRSARKSRRRKGRGRVFERSMAPAVRMSLHRLALPRAVDQAKLASAVCLLGLMCLVYYLFSSGRFFIYTADISGNQFVSREEVYANSGLHSLSVFYVNPSQVAERLTGLANIREARVSVRLPGRVTIVVQERLPQVVLESGGTRYWVDSEGVILPSRGELERAVVVEDRDGMELKPGDRIAIEAVHTAQQLRELLPEVTRLVYSRATGISVVTGEDWPVLFGNADDLPAKVAVYRSIVEKLAAQGAEVELVDLRFEGRPYYRLR